MTTVKINILGHEVIANNETGDNIDIIQLTEQVEAGDKSGNIYWDGFIVPIGTWRIVDWKAIAGILYEDLKHGFSQDALAQDLLLYESAL